MHRSFTITTLCLISLNNICSLLGFMYPSEVWAIIALASYVAFSATMSQSCPASFMLLAPLLFLRATELLSGVAIEYGGHVEELSLYGSATGAFTRLSTVLMLFFFLASALIEPQWSKVRDKFRGIEDAARRTAPALFVFALCGAAAVYLMLFGLSNGFPLIEGIDRFRYRLDLQDGAFVSIMNNIYLIALLMGVIAMNIRWRKIAITLFTALIAVLVLYSEKFTSISMLLILFLIPMGLCHAATHGKLPLRHIFYVPGFIGVITMPIILLVYGYQENPALAMQKLANRMTAQGELWWIADRDHFEFFRLEGAPIIADIKTWFNPAAQDPITVGTDFGLYYVMMPYAPSEIAYAAGQQGTGYVFSLFAYLMMTTGIAGVLVVGSLIHAVYAVTVILLMRAVADLSILRSVLAMKLFIWNVSGGFIVGYLWFFFGIKSIVLLGVLIVLERVVFHNRSSLTGTRLRNAY